jgi:hypothetical protein
VIGWYLEIQKLLRSIRYKVLEAAAAQREEHDELERLPRRTTALRGIMLRQDM